MSLFKGSHHDVYGGSEREKRRKGKRETGRVKMFRQFSAVTLSLKRMEGLYWNSVT